MKTGMRQATRDFEVEGTRIEDGKIFLAVELAGTAPRKWIIVRHYALPITSARFLRGVSRRATYGDFGEAYS